MKSFERRKIILDLVNEHKKISIKDVSKILKAKENNIRRDIKILQDLGLLKKVYGGVEINSPVEAMEKFFFSNPQNDTEKEKIGQRAFELINENDSILLSAGTTVYKLAKILYETDMKLNIITLSLPVATLLSKKKNYNVILIGGSLIKENYSFEGPLVDERLKYYHIDKSFVGVRGFSMDHGFTIPAIDQVVTIKAIAGSSDELNVLVDYSKFYKKCLVKISFFEDVVVRKKTLRVITNKVLEGKYIKRLEEENIEVILV